MDDLFEMWKEDFSFTYDDELSGPLDVLLSLLQESKVDIKDIFISNITEQYLEHVKHLEVLDIDKATNFASVAAFLLEMKVKSLFQMTPDEHEEYISDQESFINLLEEYAKIKRICQEASAGLKALETRNRFYRPADYTDHDYRYIIKDFDLDKLCDAFARVVYRIQNQKDDKAPNTTVIVKDRFTVNDKIREMIIFFKEKKEANFTDVFEDSYSVGEKVTVFLAMLELLKKQFLSVNQEEEFAEITISVKAGAEELSYEELINGKSEDYN